MSKSIEQLVGQIIIAGFRGKALEKDSDIARYVTEFNIGGVILYDEDLEIGGDGTRNIESPKQVKKLVSQLQDLSEHPLLISVDQEGGQVHRLKSVYGFEETPSWQHIGVLNDPLMTEQFAKTMASTLSGLGINLNFAPVLDLDHGQDTVISDSERAFSTDTQAIIEHSKIFIEQRQSKTIFL